MRPAILYTASLAIHLALGASFAKVKRPEKREATAIAIREVKLPPKAPPPPPVTPPPEAPEPVRPKAPPKVARPAPTAAPAPAEAPAPPSGPAVADLGLTLGGSSGGPGLAVPVGGGKDNKPKQQEHKVARVLEGPAPAAQACAEPATKARPVEVLQPAYTEEARAAQLEGKVRVEITVGPDGAVVSAKIIAGLGSGLDEAALAAARGSRFEPATQCGKPVQSTFVIGIRFTL